MKKLITLLTLAFLALLIVPVLVARTNSPDQRNFEFVELADTSFREISFENASQELMLAGMLFVPDGEGPFPAAVIIHGSGTSRRDNGWYLTLTKYLQDKGIVVLLPDKRGSEKSEGDWRTASFEDLATDTVAAVDFLKHQEQVAISEIGVIGMSQGGHFAPVAAAQSGDIAFIVNVVGGAIPMHDQLVYEENHNLRQIGVLPGLSDVLAYPAAWSLIRIRQKTFWSAIGNFDPIPYWQRTSVPSLVLYGEQDTNVPSAESAARLRALQNPEIEVKIYEGSGHALEDPIGRGNTIIRKETLDDIRDFILSVSEGS
ncbi:MAG: alpha/beta fold hydrolase [Gammaproteobacteria bacterium]|jgi:dienelactone hydrolase|nr:alpha/beta fold hydrolase [Gammaproteobacteria bacterium]